MQKFILIFFIACFTPLLSYSQRFVEEFWHQGKIYLESGDTLAGNLKFSLENELIQLDAGGNLVTLTSRKVLSFQFYDRYEQRDRFYYTLPFAKVSNYKTPSFFELLSQGDPVTVLCREVLVNQTSMVNNPYNWVGPGIPVTRRFVKANMYFLFKNGKIKPYDGTKKDLLVQLQDRESAVKDYIKNNRVRFDNRQDIIALVEYYNKEKNKFKK
jgi:hypothetical protein